MPDKIPQEIEEFEKVISNFKNDDSQQLIKNYKNFDNYLNRLITSSFSKKSYSDDHISEQLFLIKVEQKDIKSWLKYSLWAYKRTFERLLESPEKVATSQKFRELILDLVFELIIFLQHFHYVVDNKKVDYGRGRRNIADPIEFISLANQLFLKELKERHISSFLIRPTSVVLIRQAIELRVKTILGIKDVYTKSGITPKIKSEFFFSFLKKNSEEISLPTKISILEKIFEWTNIYIHNGFIPPLYQIEWALFNCNKFFAPYSDETSWHMYGSVEISKSFWVGIKPVLEKSILEHCNYIEKDDLVIEMITNPTAKIVS